MLLSQQNIPQVKTKTKKIELIFDQTLRWLYHVIFSSTNLLFIPFASTFLFFIEHFSCCEPFFFSYSLGHKTLPLRCNYTHTGSQHLSQSTYNVRSDRVKLFLHHFFRLSFSFDAKSILHPFSFVCCQVKRVKLITTWKELYQQNEMQKKMWNKIRENIEPKLAIMNHLEEELLRLNSHTHTHTKREK